MVKQSQGKIFLQEERGQIENDFYRSYNTFNFGQRTNEHKQPVGNLYMLNDDTLGPQRYVDMTVPENSLLVLLPLVGEITYRDSLLGVTEIIRPGQVLVKTLPAGTSYTLRNPYDEALINFLQIWVRVKDDGHRHNQLHQFDLEMEKNQLLDIKGSDYLPQPVQLSIGKFDGRREWECTLDDDQSLVFLFVIQGVFEAEGRLLQSRDGLALWDTPLIETEALSNDAIILFIKLNKEL